MELFQQLKTKISSDKNLVDELADLLQVSTDSAYRRLRGEKSLSFDELYTICIHYRLSLDNLFNLHSDAFVFGGHFVQPSTFSFWEYLEGIAKNLKYMLTFRDRKLYYLCKDISIFHHFHFREVAAFKHFFWMKAYIQSPQFANKKFRLSDYPDDVFEKGRELLNSYNQFDSVEIWNIENINSTLRQVAFYHDAGAFQYEEEVYQIYEALEKLLLHLEEQADAGYKFQVNGQAHAQGKYQMYYNEVFLGDNSILVTLDGNKVVYLVHSLFNYIATRDVSFCDYTFDYVQNLIRKSALISTVSEKERARFFKYLRNRISTRKNHMKN